MAFITKSTDVPCYSCSKHCINLEFCRSSNTNNASLGLGGLGYTFTRNMRVNIIANPDFWGFGTKETNVLISGWATYNESFYDFFDGYDKDHEAYKDCGISAGFFPDEQRPDVLFRSVYDPDTGLTVHYDASGNISSTGGTGRGGAEVYLVDRSGGQFYPISGDQPSCDTQPPHQSFRTFPENFGWGNKINLSGDIYRNISGGWRLTSLENCYSESEIYKPSGYLIDCSSEEKQNIAYKNQRYADYEPTRPRGSGISLYSDYAEECRPDGSIAGKYRGYFYAVSGINRETSSSPFIVANLSYGKYGTPIAASGLKNGMSIGIKTLESGHLFNNVYTIFDISHNSDHTSVKLVGTHTENLPFQNVNPSTNQIESIPTGNFVLNIPSDSGHWVAFNTLDPQTCCGLAAYGVSDKDKKLSNPKNYHTDFRRIFNNPKNLRQSNRDKEWRYTYAFYDSGIDPVTTGVRLDYSYPSVSGIEIWHSGSDSPIVYGFPIIMSGNQQVVATGNTFVSGYPLFEREKSYYGMFFETDKFDSGNRIEQKINRGKGVNGTCYSKAATLEIFPDCYTQYDKIDHCNYGETYPINRIARLAFIYRGCDFNDDCSFDSSGLPLGGWKDHGSVPTNMNDLKRLLAGQEIHMFLNLNNAWGGRHSNQPCPCDCDNSEGGYKNPEHVQVRSPMRFPGFPNFDGNPLKYGCADARHQVSSIINLERSADPDFFANSEYCDPLHTSPNVCRVRQPYTTYGYMVNLCGKESNSRRETLEAFNKINQQKTYTNKNPTETGVVEPMYWEFTAPIPAPYNPDNTWSSGVQPLEGIEEISGVPFDQVGGSGYPFWGLADHFNNLVAPYFCTQRSTAICGCDGDPIATNIDFSVTGTFQNVLNTDTGWPTDAVPFLIELEVEEGCNNCASTVMDSGNLVLELSGLPTEFLWDQKRDYGDINSVTARYGQYGHNYCKYGPITQDVANFGKAKYDLRPNYSCDTGFDLSLCNGTSENADQVWASYTGNTCGCADGFTATLYPKIVPSSELILGWTSNPNGNAAGLIDITGCADLASSYFSVAYDAKVEGGYKIWAQFDLSCNQFVALTPAEYPDAKYEGDPLATIWGGGTCGHQYPAGNSDMKLQTTLWMIDVRHEETFSLLSSYALKRIAGMNLGNGYLKPPDKQNFWGNQESNYFGLCPGDYIYSWGCKPEGTYFYGEQDDEGRYKGSYAVCESSTPCNTCPVGTGPGQVTCVCGQAAGYEGVIPHPIPIVYQLNECDCLCTTPHLLAKYVIDPDSSGMSIVDTYGNDVALATAYWYSFDGSDPILAVQGPPAPYMGIKLTSGGGTDANWHDWSHGENGVVNGITHELYQPYRGRDYLLAGTECDQLTVDYQSINSLGWVPPCEENTGCALDNDVLSKTCGLPVYSTNANFATQGYPVRKLKCAPEVAIVTKIEAIGNGFKLYIAREYYEHDRTWYEQRVVGTGDEAEMKCISVNMGAYEYNDGTNSGCQLLPYSVLSDTVTPVSDWPCAVHPSSGVFVNQSYQYSVTGTFPSGSHVWNYYNLFYADGVLEPSVNFGEIKDSIHFNEDSGTWHCTGTPDFLWQAVSGKRVFTNSDYYTPANFNGIFATTGTHSCIQDANQCGGNLWCNKLFFPRHSYKAGTLVAPFGGGRICTGSMNINNITEWQGYNEAAFSDEYDVPLSRVTIEGAEPVLEEMKTRFVDYCSYNLTQGVLADVGIDDNYILVTDYLPLMGVVHPGWRYTSDVKSCTVAVSGYLPNVQTHTNQSISAGVFAPKTWDDNKFESMGYYLDAYGVTYSGENTVRKANISDNCLFNPFKILIDVECNTNRIRRKDVITDAPTLLQGVQNWDARACQGIIQGVSCGCAGTQCKYATKDRAGTCIGFRLAEYEASLSSDADGPCYCGATPIGEWYHESLLANPNGITPTEPRCCSGCTECPGPGAWVAKPCDETGNKIVRVGNPYSQVKMWECDTYQYLHDHPGEFGIIFPSGDCDCGAKYTEGLCGARWRCTDYTSCSCNPVSSGQQFVVNTPTSGDLSEWWADGDCHCDRNPQDDAAGSQHCRDSIIKWTITEAL